MGFCLYIGTPSAIQTALALRKAIWYKQDTNWSVCGILEILYTDHGTDFTSTHIDYVCADLKIQLIHSIVGKPKGRGKVERFFLSLEQKLIERLKINNKTYKLSELEELIKGFIINDYHHTIHSTTGEAPIVLWNKQQIIPQMPDSIEKLNLLLITAKKCRIVQRDGIRFAGFRYFHQNLIAYVGESIIIHFDPNDLSEIWVYEQNQLICKAVCEAFQDQSITYEELKRLRTNRKKELKQEINSDTLKALIELDKIVMSLYMLDYIDDEVMRKCVHRSLNRVESYQQLRSAIAKVGGRKLVGKTEIELIINNECARLIAISIIFYNASLLSGIYEHFRSEGMIEECTHIIRLSPVAWVYINLIGKYEFNSNVELPELADVIWELVSKFKSTTEFKKIY